MNREITTEEEHYFHLKYGLSLNSIHNIWKMSNNADELKRNFEASISLAKTLEQIYKKGGK